MCNPLTKFCLSASRELSPHVSGPTALILDKFAYDSSAQTLYARRGVILLGIHDARAAQQPNPINNPANIKFLVYSLQEYHQN